MKTILVVDDDPTNTGLLQMLLELDGYKVITCPGIKEAKEAASQDVDAFIIDCHLAKGASGLTLLQDIRAGQTAAAAESFVIMVSGDNRLQDESINSGANQFLLKPYSSTALSQLFIEWLGE